MGSYDAASVCENGHTINTRLHGSPQFSRPFCSSCGAKAVTACSHCKAPIPGHYIDDPSPVLVLSIPHYDPPSFCESCGNAFPWTAARIKAGQQLAMEVDGLNDKERRLLAETFPDLVANTPRTELAMTRFQKLSLKVKGEGANALRVIITKIGTDLVKQRLGLP